MLKYVERLAGCAEHVLSLSEQFVLPARRQVDINLNCSSLCYCSSLPLLHPGKFGAPGRVRLTAHVLYSLLHDHPTFLDYDFTEKGKSQNNLVHIKESDHKDKAVLCFQETAQIVNFLLIKKG